MQGLYTFCELFYTFTVTEILTKIKKAELAVIEKRRKNREVSSETLSRLIAKGMLEKKATEVIILDLRNIQTAVADFFVICSGNSDTQIDAISQSIEEEVYKAVEAAPWQKEGKLNREWILIDYVDVVAHVFRKDRRLYYDLEGLWGDAGVTRVEDDAILPIEME